MNTVPTAPTHPHWCSPARCTAAGGGAHESEPRRVTSGGRGRAPRLLLLLVQTGRTPTRMRLVVIGELLINTVDLDLDTADLAAAHIKALLQVAQRPEEE